MKFVAYKYEKGAVKLEFSFPDDEKLFENKKDFRELLIIAASELVKENETRS